MLNKSLFSTTLIATAIIAAPAFAQSQIDNNQPVQGSLHSREIDIQNKLNASYAAGVISSTELAEMQRDLDGILVKEDRKRTKSGPSNGADLDPVAKALDMFESKLVRQSNRIAATTVVPVDGATITPITGNQSSIIQPAEKTYLVPTATIAPTTTTTQTTTTRQSVIAPIQTTTTRESVIMPTP